MHSTFGWEWIQCIYDEFHIKYSKALFSCGIWVIPFNRIHRCENYLYWANIGLKCDWIWRRFCARILLLPVFTVIDFTNENCLYVITLCTIYSTGLFEIHSYNVIKLDSQFNRRAKNGAASISRVCNGHGQLKMEFIECIPLYLKYGDLKAHTVSIKIN